MSLSFKSNMEEMRENDPTNEQAMETDNKASENYDTPGRVRNLCFVWPDGRMKFMNYAYLISSEYSPNECEIILTFAAEIIIIKGADLKPLFTNILDQIPKFICYAMERYQQLSNNLSYTVKEIVVNKL